MSGNTAFKTGDIAVACNHYQMHWITPNKEYEVLEKEGAQILVFNDYGTRVWKHAKFFNKKVEVKKVAQKMTHYDPKIGHFIIGSLTTKHGFSAVAAPKPHKTEESARKECERLAALDPDKKFVYLEVKGACTIPGAVWE